MHIGKMCSVIPVEIIKCSRFINTCSASALDLSKCTNLIHNPMLIRPYTHPSLRLDKAVLIVMLQVKMMVDFQSYTTHAPFQNCVI